MKSLLLMLMTANVVCAGYTATMAWGTRNEATAPEPRGVPTLRLVTEQPATIEIREPIEPGAHRACSAWGPFASAADAQRFGARLPGASPVDLISDTVVGTRAFLVYVAPDEAAADDAALVHVLRANGIESQSVASGDLAAALAVGVFAHEGAAEAQARRLKALGVPTHVVPLLAGSAAYHLVAASRRGDDPENRISDECDPIAPG